MKTKKAMTDQSMLWGSPVSFWDLWGLRFMFIGAALGTIALAVSLASSFVLYKVADRTQSEADQRIAEANARGEEAKADAARAAEHAKLLEKAVAEANAKALEAKLELEKFRAPRLLSAGQIASITEAAKPFAGQKFEGQVASGVQDAFMLWVMLDKALTDAGWIRQVPSGPMVGNPPASVSLYPPVGVVFGFAKGNKGQELTTRAKCVPLVMAIGKAGIRATVAFEGSADIPTDTIIVAIGTKPQ